MAQSHRTDEDALRPFLRRVWREDITPLLRDRHAARRRKSARAVGKVAAATGLMLDGVLGLKGKPFTRFLTVTGASLGALLPDAWDWEWLRGAEAGDREVVDAEVARQAAALPEQEALALFGLTPSSTGEELREAWHAVSLRWHPDRARDEAGRREHHLRFLVYQAAHERLVRAYEEGRLPEKSKNRKVEKSK